MSENIGYVVAVINQASHQFDDTLSSANLHFSEEDAAWERDLRESETGQTGRRDRYVVCEVVPVEDQSP